MLRVENEKLKAAAEEKERETRAELDRLEQEQRKANIAAAKLKKEAEAKLAAEKAEKECLLAELKAKEEAEAKAELERQALIEAELTKGDKAKIADMIADLEAIKTKYEFKAKKNKILYLAVISLLDKIIVYINQKH
jgi:colicin import membrane protein